MLRVFQPEPRFNNLDDWHFADIAHSLGGIGERVTTRRELAAALDRAVTRRGQFSLIEIMLQRGKTSDTLERFIAGFKADGAVVGVSNNCWRACGCSSRYLPFLMMFRSWAVRSAIAEGMPKTVIAAVLLLHESSVDEIVGKLRPRGLEVVIKLAPPGTLNASKAGDKPCR